jgi:hypothetical protein
MDQIAQTILVRSPLDQLSDVLSAYATETHRDVLGAEMELSGDFALSCQIVGQAWSILATGGFVNSRDDTSVAIPSPSQLSQQLGQPVIKLCYSDTGGHTNYALFEGGEIVEYFWGSEGALAEWFNEYDLLAQRYLLAGQVAYFWSTRQVSANALDNIWDFVERFICEWNAYDPGINLRYLLGKRLPLLHPGRYRIQNPGFMLLLDSGETVTSVPKLVGVDYFRFGD